MQIEDSVVNPLTYRRSHPPLEHPGPSWRVEGGVSLRPEGLSHSHGRLSRAKGRDRRSDAVSTPRIRVVRKKTVILFFVRTGMFIRRCPASLERVLLQPEDLLLIEQLLSLSFQLLPPVSDLSLRLRLRVGRKGSSSSWVISSLLLTAPSLHTPYTALAQH